MNNLEKAKEIIKENYAYATCGIFNTRNLCNDKMKTIYNKGGLQVDICYYYEYFEVFGLSEKEFTELEKFYYEEGEQYDK